MATLTETFDPAPRTEDWWQSKVEEQRKHVESTAVRALLIGDSLAARWPKHVAWPGAGSVHRYAIGGDRTQHILWRLECLDFSRLAACELVIFAGANNVTAGPTETAVAAGILAVAAYVRKKLPHAKLTVMAVPLRGPNFTYKRAFIECTNTIVAAAADNIGFHHIDTNAAVLRASGGLNPSYLFDDEVHYSAIGYAFLAGFVDHARHA